MQFQISQGTFKPCGTTTGRLEPGVYAPILIPNGLGQEPAIKQITRLVTDKLLVLDDSPIEQVTGGIDRFWKAKDKYRKHGVIHKRSIMLEGPPGTGKSSIAYKISQWVVEQKGIVLIVEHRYTMALRMALQWIRDVQDTPILVVIEDFDKFMPDEDFEDHIDTLMQLMDGFLQIENIVYILTTNFIDRIDPRFMKRPSRIDEIIHVGKPSAKTRRAFLAAQLEAHGPVNKTELNDLVKQSDGLYIAHLRELVLATKILDQDRELVLKRLFSMVTTPEELEGTSRSQRRQKQLAEMFRR